MKKINSIPVVNLIVVQFLLPIILTSCSNEQIVAPPPSYTAYQFDSARFDWKVDTLYGGGFIAGLWAADTNEIFIPNIYSNYLVHIKNGIKSNIPFSEDNRVGGIYGDETNVGYRAGAILQGSLFQPLIQKWSGNNFVDIGNSQNLDRNFFYWTGFVKNSMEMWFGLTDGDIIEYNGSEFMIYPLFDSRIQALKFFYDENNKFKLLASIFHPEIVNGGKTEFLIYEFTGSQWIKIFSDLDSPRPLRYNILNEYVTSINEHTIFELIDSTLLPRITLDPVASNFSMDGYSFNNIIVPSPIRVQGRVSSLFHWNGNKWSLELSGYSTDPLTEVYMISEDYYYVVSYDQNLFTFIMQGRR